LGDYRVLGISPLPTLALLSSHVRRGFTLIEIAIVLVVIGLLLSGGLLAVSPVIQSAQTSETRQKIATVESAILGYVIANGCLPCPAQVNLATNNAAAGLTNNGAATYTGCSAGACVGGGVGTVPWVSLGISEGDATDAWGQRLRFGVDPTRTAASSVQRNADGTFPAFTSTIAIEDTDNTTIAGYTAVAYVILSHGPDGSFGEATQTGTTQADRYGQAAGNAGEDQHENGNGNLTFAIGLFDSTTSVEHFDDIVSFKSFQQLILSCGSGSCGNPS